MDRRRFLKVTAITGTTAALASCGSPENQIVRFIPDEELVPGIAVWKPSVCPLCAAGCGVTARVMDGDAEVFRKGQPGVTRMGLVRKLEGDPAHPISRGRLCVRGQAAVQVTYHPDRLVAPQRRSGERGSGQFTEISWDEALALLVERLDAGVAAGPAQIAFLSRPRRGRRHELVTEFLRRLGAPAPIAFEIFDDAVLRRANELSFGRYQLPTLDLAHTRYLVNFGADLLGTWNSPVAHSAAYGAMRQGRAGMRAKFVQVEPRMSQTGASADEWLAVRAGTEGALALGLAHVIVEGWPSARKHRRPRRGAGRRLVGRIGGVHARRRGAHHRGGRRAGRTAGPGVCRQQPGGGGDWGRVAGADQRARTGPGGKRVECPGGKRRWRRRRDVHAAACRPRRAGADAAGGAVGSPATDLAPRRGQPDVCRARSLEGGRVAAPNPVHRELRLLHRRHERARRPDPSRPLVSRVVGRLGPRVGRR